jgi:transcriptional regulator
MAMAPRRDLLPGTLDMLVLRPERAAYARLPIARQIERVSDDVLRIEEGSLYPALQRMRQKGWIKAEWRQTPNNQRARYYTITTAGRKRLGAEEAGFAELLAAIGRVMGSA